MRLKKLAGLCAAMLVLGCCGFAGAQGKAQGKSRAGAQAESHAAMAAQAGTRPSGPAVFSMAGNHVQESLLDGLWRFHPGNNPAWAEPGFDDSHWALIRPDVSWTKQGFPNRYGYGWYRFDFYQPDGTRPLAFMIGRCISSCTVFADGKLIGSTGTTKPSRVPVGYPWKKVFPVPAGGAGPRTIHFAIRVWAWAPIASWNGAEIREGVEIGDPALMALRLQENNALLKWAMAGSFAVGVFALLVGLTMLALFLFHPEDREYLWFSIVLLGMAAMTVLFFVQNLVSIRFVWIVFWNQCAGATSGIAALLFFSNVLRVRRGVLWWMACLALAVSPLTAGMLFFDSSAELGILLALTSLLALPTSAWVIGALAVRAVKKDVAALLLLAPSVLYYGFRLLSFGYRAAGQLTGHLRLAKWNVHVVSQPYPLGLSELTTLVFILSLLIFLVWRFATARQQQVRLSSEMEAARSVQGLLVPAEAQGTREFGVESVYLPAREVSGDFFQILPQAEDGSVLVVAGDVAGKGLPAGMLVAVLVGAIRSVAEMTREPLAMLAVLNRRLLGRGNAKATCLALLLKPGGSAVLANAGHLPPYVNGKALEMEGALPLGVIEGAEFSEMEFQLGAGGKLVMISDGILEATDERGNLFGFERVEELLRTAKSAAEIAEAAQRFGQEDDISVIAVTRR